MKAASTKRKRTGTAASRASTSRKTASKKTGSKKATAIKTSGRSGGTARKATVASRSSSKPRARTTRGTKMAGGKKRRPGEVVLLSGGNPQIAKGDGDAPVQAYIAAMPGWKSAVGKRLDALIERSVPHVQKSVRWNSPFYAVEGHGFIASFHVFTKYIKLTFFNGIALRPMPPGGTPKSGQTRWIDIYEGQLDEAQLATWIKQAAALPGWMTS